MWRSLGARMEPSIGPLRLGALRLYFEFDSGFASAGRYGLSDGAVAGLISSSLGRRPIGADMTAHKECAPIGDRRVQLTAAGSERR